MKRTVKTFKILTKKLYLCEKITTQLNKLITLI